MWTYCNRLQPALQNLQLYGVVWFFHPRSSRTTHILANIRRIMLNASSCVKISGGRTKQLDIIADFLPRHSHYEWYSQFHVCSGVDLSWNLRRSGLLRSSQQPKRRPKFVFVFGAENGLYGHFRVFPFFGRKWIFFFVLFFVPKISLALGRKCNVRNWTVTKFCDIGTDDFRFRTKMEFRFRQHFRLRPKMKNAS